MSDAGEGLVDADARLQELRDDREREKKNTAAAAIKDPERLRLIQSLRLARAELASQSAVTLHPIRREQIALAIAELDRRLAEA